MRLQTEAAPPSRTACATPREGRAFPRASTLGSWALSGTLDATYVGMRLIKLLATLGLVGTLGACYVEAGGPRYAHHHRHRTNRGTTVIIGGR